MLALILVLLVAAATMLVAVEIKCEKIARFNKAENCCYFNKSTVIDVNNVTIGDLENGYVHGISFFRNEKIKFLAVKVYEKFRNLREYSAGYTSIKEVSALNFEKLSSLEILNLEGNKIESIPDDIFQGLYKLSKIKLGK